MRALLHRVNSITENVSGALLLLATFMTFAMVITRYAFAWSDPSVEILSRYLMIWAALLGVAGAVNAGSEIRFTLLEGLLPPLGQKVFRTLGLIVAAALSAGLAISGVRLVEETIAFNEVMPTALRWPIWIFHAAVPAGACFLGLQLVARAVLLWRDDGESARGAPGAHL